MIDFVEPFAVHLRLPRFPHESGRALRAALMLPGLLVSPALAADGVVGIGSRDCGAFMRAVAINSREAVDAYVAWGQGFLSGQNLADPSAPAVTIDGQALVYSLIDYCQGHPDHTVYEALAALVAGQRR